MNVRVHITKSFKTAAKPLLKRYPSLRSDLLKLEKELTSNPKQGTPLGTILSRYGSKLPAKGGAKAVAPG